MDCGDNSCSFAPKKGGMRTNGGCRCLDAVEDRALARAIRRAFQDARTDGYRAGVEAAAKLLKKREEAHCDNIHRWGQAGDERAESTSIQLASECSIAADAIRALAPAASTEKP